MFERYLEMLKEKGIKNIDVSRATGIPASTFSDWKKGKSSPKRDKIEKIANFFDTNKNNLTTSILRQVRLHNKYTITKSSLFYLMPQRMLSRRIYKLCMVCLWH